MGFLTIMNWDMDNMLTLFAVLVAGVLVGALVTRHLVTRKFLHNKITTTLLRKLRNDTTNKKKKEPPTRFTVRVKTNSRNPDGGSSLASEIIHHRAPMVIHETRASQSDDTHFVVEGNRDEIYRILELPFVTFVQEADLSQRRREWE